MKFLFFDSCGVLLWAGCYISLGYYFASELEAVAEYALRLGQLLTVLLVFALGVYIAAKYRQRMAFIRDLNVARITPMELKRMLDAKEPVQIVDLRNSLDYEAEPVTLPGAKHFDPIEIDRLIPEISLDRDVILYCT